MQEKWNAKVIKHGCLSKRIGRVFKAFKEFEVFLLDTGFILFYNPCTDMSEMFMESEGHRIELDETVRIEDINKISPMGDDEITKFTIKVGRQSMHLESLTEDGWVHTI